MVFDRRSTELQVLVVEPKDLVAARLKEQLQRLGHRVLGQARNGPEAVAAAQRLQPNLVVMEEKLPRFDGIDTARAIVTDRPVPVILLTDYAGAEFVRRAREAGVVAYLTSVDRTRLVSAIEMAVERFEQLQILRGEGGDPSEASETRRLVERAKKVLITRLGCSEAEAFRHILERKMSTDRSLRETAWTIVNVEEVLSELDFARSLQLIVGVIRRDLRQGSGRPAKAQGGPAPKGVGPAP
jgi:two-component system, response regulator PdtaR